MASAPIPVDELERLRALESYEILDTPADEVFDKITRLACTIFNVPIALVSLVDKERQWFKSRQGLSACETPREMAFCTHAILDSKVYVISDAAIDPLFLDNPLVTGDPNIRFYAGAPLIAPSGQKLGTLCIIDREPRSLTDEQKSMLQDLASLVMDELELRLLASTDSLTGALNRRHFMELGEREIHRASRYCRPLSVIMFDIDRFKSVNDTYGHLVGDHVLTEFTALCRQVLRQEDILGRYGGEEFAVVLPETKKSEAFELAERLRQLAAETVIEVADSKLNFTLSAGVAAFQLGYETFDDTLHRADQALYEAKRNGRNRVVMDCAA